MHLSLFRLCLRSEPLAMAAGAAVGQQNGQPTTFAVHALMTDIFWKHLYPYASKKMFLRLGGGPEARAACVAIGLVAGVAVPHLATRFLVTYTGWGFPILGRLKQEHEKEPGLGTYLTMCAVSAAVCALCRMKEL